MSMKLNDTVVAVFKPTTVHNLAPSALRDIGKQGRFIAAWLIEAGELYAGQYAMVPTDEMFHFAWCPEEDLTFA